MSVSGRINYLRNMLRGESLQELYELASQDNGTENAHLKFIQEVLLRYLSNKIPVQEKLCDATRNA